MKVLIIDNGSRYIDSLVGLTHKHTTKVVPYNHIDRHALGKDSLVILSGGHGSPVLWHAQEYAREIDIIQNHKGPVIGICLGFELIAHVFGARLHLMEQRVKGLVRIKSTSESNVLAKGKTASVYANHNWSVQKMPALLKEIARSKDGVEIFKHSDRPVYGLQFHPESETVNNGGKLFLAVLQDLGI